MAKKRRAGRQVSGNPAKAAAQLQLEQHLRAVRSQKLPAYRSPTGADWERLEEDPHAKYPQCPDCGGPLSEGEGEEGVDDAGSTVISMYLWCGNFDAEDPVDRKPHPLTNGIVQLEATLD